MNGLPNFAAAPVAALEAEAAAYGALLGLLRVEQQALVAADAAAVQAALVDKSRQVDLLMQAGHRRVDALRRSGFAPDASGMAAWLADPAREPQLRPLWAEITRLAEEARAQNAINGRLIATQQRHWDRALASLWQAAGMTTTYGADGRTQTRPPPRSYAAT